MKWMLNATMLGSFIGGVVRGLWFLPGVVALCIGLAAFATLALDRTLGPGPDLDMSLHLDIDGYRSILSTIAGGVITLTSIVISLTFVALSSLSSQLGPRVLLFFMDDRPTQLSMGAFVGVCLNTLIVLIYTGESGVKPQISAIVAVGLAVSTLVLMIFFVQHIARSMQADVVVARLGGKLAKAVVQVCEAAPNARPANDADWTESSSPQIFCAEHGGYVQNYDRSILRQIASEADGVVELDVRLADFVVKGEPLARMHHGQLEDSASLLSAFVLGPQRTPEQHAHFEIVALSEVALRALSPSVNDPYTAISCIDRLVEGLEHISRLEIAGDLAHEVDGKVVLIERKRDFADYLDAAFAPIRNAACSDALVMGHIVGGYAKLAALVSPEQDLAALREALEGVREDIERSIENQRDRADLLRKTDAALAPLNARAA